MKNFFKRLFFIFCFFDMQKIYSSNTVDFSKEDWNDTYAKAWVFVDRKEGLRLEVYDERFGGTYDENALDNVHKKIKAIRLKEDAKEIFYLKKTLEEFALNPEEREEKEREIFINQKIKKGSFEIDSNAFKKRLEEKRRRKTTSDFLKSDSKEDNY